MLAEAPTREDETVLYEDAEDLLRDAVRIVENLVPRVAATLDLNAVAQWRRRVQKYFGD